MRKQDSSSLKILFSGGEVPHFFRGFGSFQSGHVGKHTHTQSENKEQNERIRKVD
jgi:hypothetical protein